jgi:hypothetical protein
VFAIDLFEPDSYDGLRLVTHELDGIRDQILHDLHDPDAIYMHKREDRIDLHLNLPGLKDPIRGLECVPHNFLKRQIFRRVNDPPDAREVEQFIHEFAHLPGGLIDLRQVLFCPLVVASFDVLFQITQESCHGDLRCFEIMGDAYCKPIQFLVF